MNLQEQRQIETHAQSLIHDIDKGMFNVHAIKGFLLKFAGIKEKEPVKKTRKQREDELTAKLISELGINNRVKK